MLTLCFFCSATKICARGFAGIKGHSLVAPTSDGKAPAGLPRRRLEMGFICQTDLVGNGVAAYLCILAEAVVVYQRIAAAAGDVGSGGYVAFDDKLSIGRYIRKQIGGCCGELSIADDSGNESTGGGNFLSVVLVVFAESVVIEYADDSAASISASDVSFIYVVVDRYQTPGISRRWILISYPSDNSACAVSGNTLYYVAGVLAAGDRAVVALFTYHATEAFVVTGNFTAVGAVLDNAV